MSILDRLISEPRLQEIDRVELAADADRAWEAVRGLDLAQSPVVRTLFGLRTIPDRMAGREAQLRLRLVDLTSTPDRPGFQRLAEDSREFVAGAIGKVWRPVIPFVHVPDAAAFASFSEKGYVKVAWSLRVVAENERTSRAEFEVRVAGTDDEAWRKFSRYFRLIGPGSHFIRRIVLAQLARDLGTPESVQNDRPLPGDDLIPDATGQFTHSIVIGAPPEEVWPWLVQMGCGRGGFYSIDLLDNGGVPSAGEIRPDLQQLRVGDRVPSRPGTDDHFDVLRIQPAQALVLGVLLDMEHRRQRPFDAPRPRRFWQVSWAFVLEPLDSGRTRLYARARGAFPASERFHAFWIRPLHHLMQTAQLRHLAERAEGRASSAGLRDAIESVGGAVASAVCGLFPAWAEKATRQVRRMPRAPR